MYLLTYLQKYMLLYYYYHHHHYYSATSAVPLLPYRYTTTITTTTTLATTSTIILHTSYRLKFSAIAWFPCDSTAVLCTLVSSKNVYIVHVLHTTTITIRYYYY